MAFITNIFAVVMFSLGLVGYLSNPSKALSSLIVGVVVGIVFTVIAQLVRKRKRGALVLLAVAAGLLSVMLVWRVNTAWMAYFGGSSEKLLAATLMSCMLVLSLVMTGLGIIVRLQLRR